MFVLSRSSAHARTRPPPPSTRARNRSFRLRSSRRLLFARATPRSRGLRAALPRRLRRTPLPCPVRSFSRSVRLPTPSAPLPFACPTPRHLPRRGREPHVTEGGGGLLVAPSHCFADVHGRGAWSGEGAAAAARRVERRWGPGGLRVEVSGWGAARCVAAPRSEGAGGEVGMRGLHRSWASHMRAAGGWGACEGTTCESKKGGEGSAVGRAEMGRTFRVPVFV